MQSLPHVPAPIRMCFTPTWPKPSLPSGDVPVELQWGGSCSTRYEKPSRNLTLTWMEKGTLSGAVSNAPPSQPHLPPPDSMLNLSMTQCHTCPGTAVPARLIRLAPVELLFTVTSQS